MSVNSPKWVASVLREVAALNGGPRGGLLSRSHRITTFLGLGMKVGVPVWEVVWTMSMSEVADGGVGRRHSMGLKGGVWGWVWGLGLKLRVWMDLQRREEFCLVTGLKFGVENWTDYNNAEEPIPFRRRAFSSSLDGRPIRGKNVETLIKSEAFNKLDDNDAVSLCCVVSLGFACMANIVPATKDANVKRWPALYATQPTNEIDKKSYLITALLGHS
nr:hypothetical protein [Tanacetum cinerariifolium]